MQLHNPSFLLCKNFGFLALQVSATSQANICFFGWVAICYHSYFRCFVGWFICLSVFVKVALQDKADACSVVFTAVNPVECVLPVLKKSFQILPNPAFCSQGSHPRSNCVASLYALTAAQKKRAAQIRAKKTVKKKKRNYKYYSAFVRKSQVFL